MDFANIISAIILVLAAAGAFAIVIYRNYKLTGEKIDFNLFISIYGNKIINVLKDVVRLIKIEESDFSSKEEYENAIIEATLKEIKENYKEIGIEEKYLNIVSEEKLADVICDILHGNAIDIFSVLDIITLNENKNLYGEEIVTAIEKSQIVLD